jgi:purine-cytosine permease-like protein
MSTGTTALYGTGLDMSSMFPKFLNRVRATLLIGSLAIGFIFLGRFAFNLVESVSTFSVLINVCSCPWMVIMIIGFVTRRGFYLSDDLQVFNRGGRGGHYWFKHGWNWRAMGAWIPSAVIGLCFVNLPDQFVGPLGQLAGGLDISMPVSLTLACALYIALLQCFPEPDGVYGPLGRRWLRSGLQRNVIVHPVVPATKLKAGGAQMKTQPQQRAVRREREEALDTQDAG